MQGAHEGGVTGFLQGVGTGLLGGVFKPVSGVVDFISKSTEGLENQATGVPDCFQNCSRMRAPRPFYRSLNVIRSYNKVHANVFNQLKFKYKITKPFYGAFKCGVGQTDTNDTELELGAELLILTTETFYAVSRDMNIVWQAEICEIEKFDFQENLQHQSKLTLTQQKGAAKRDFVFTTQEQFLDCQAQVSEIQHMIK